MLSGLCGDCLAQSVRPKLHGKFERRLFSENSLSTASPTNRMWSLTVARCARKGDRKQSGSPREPRATPNRWPSRAWAVP